MSGMGRPKKGGGVEAAIFLWVLFVVVPIVIAVAIAGSGR